MIILNTGATNIVSLSLSDSVTITNPYYVFKFIDDDNNSKVFYCADISLNSRTQDFSITLTGGTEDLSGGTTLLNWAYNEKTRYFIYQCSSANIVDLTNSRMKSIKPDTTFNQDVDYIETGFVWVNAAQEIPITNYTESDSDTKVVYRG